MKILIIDDDIAIRKIIVRLFQKYFTDPYEVVEADNVQTGINAIEEQHPEIVLLDINLPDGSGFDLLKRLRFLDFKLIFITAYEEFALKAYKFPAIGFILKPPDPKKLFRAIEKAKSTLEKENIKMKLNALFVKLDNPVFENNLLEVKTKDKSHTINTYDIVRCEAEKESTRFYMLDGGKILVHRKLEDYELMLDGYGFYRIHPSHLINLKYIDHYSKSAGGEVVMKEKSCLPVVHYKKGNFLKLLEMI
ncbi:MAG: response regulator transcription factor [Chlorobi bacterium]|nr:response regulator transcription factor [Chlorobiota bacterium]